MMAVKNEYWVNRSANAARKRYNRSLASIDTELRVLYKSVLTGLKIDVVRLWEKINSDGEDFSMDSLYRYQRYQKLMEKLNKELHQLGEKEINVYGKKFAEMAEFCSQNIMDEAIAANYPNASFLLIDKDKIKLIVNEVWCADGKSWSERVWNNKSAMQQQIEKGLMNCIARGAPKDELVKDLMDKFGVGFRQADRLARTELAHIQNAATVESYKQAGVAEVKTIVASDNRLCDICSKHDGQITPIVSAKPGTAYLFHPNCRCDIIPIL